MAGFGFLLTLGYLLGGRSWAYLGIAGANLYIAEATIAAIIVHGPTRRLLFEMLRQLVRPGRFHILAVVAVLFLGYGLVQTSRGVTGTDPVALLKSLPLYYYTIFLVFGLWLGLRSPDVLVRLMWALAWGNAVYGLLYESVLNRLKVTIPGQPDTNVFDLGLTSSGVALVGLLAVPRRSRWTIPLVLANTAVLFGHQIRAEWLGLLVAVIVWTSLARRVRRLMIGLGAILLLFVAVTVTGVTLPGPQNRGGEVRLGDIVGRALGPVSPGLAERYTAEDRASAAAETANFRRQWWDEIWRTSQNDPTTLLFGHGYGYNLQQLAPPRKIDEKVRNPHNTFFYTLGYTGWLGVVLLALWLGVLARLLWCVFRVTRDPIGFAVFSLMVVGGQFEPWFETPFGAATVYLLVGMCLAPLARPAPSRRPPGARGEDTRRRRPARAGRWGERRSRRPRRPRRPAEMGAVQAR
jgi:hypothetical protein